MPSLWDKMRGKTGYKTPPLGEVTAVERMQDMQKNLKNSRSDSRYKSSDEFERVYDCLKDLNTICGWNANDINRPMLEEAHKALGEACKSYLESRAGARTGRGRERYAMVGEIYRLHLDEKQDLGNDRVMEEAAGKGKPWRDVLHGSRVLRAVSPPDKKFVSGAVSSRMEIKHGGRTGYFTAEDDAWSTRMIRMDRRGEDTFPTLVDQVKDEKIKNSIKNKGYEVWQAIGLQPFTEYHQYSASIERSKVFENAVNTHLTDLTDSTDKKAAEEALRNIAKTSSSIKTMGNTMTAAKIDLENANKLYNRNIASSRFAGLVGNGNLIARSDRMVLDGAIQGSFMEQAQGEDLKKLGKEGGQKLAGVSNFKNPDFLRQMSNLEIIDWVTGQVDRHSGNMFYQVDDNNTITGIQGIDNDMAFGSIPAKENATERRVNIKDITRVDEALKISLASLDETVIEYEFGDILNKDEQKALVERIKRMNEHLKSQQVVTIKSHEWAQKVEDVWEQLNKGRDRYLTTAKEDIEEAQRQYQASVRTPVQESQLAAEEKNAAADGGKQKAAPGAEAQKTSEAPTVSDDKAEATQEQAQAKSAEQAQAKPVEQAQAKSVEQAQAKSVEQAQAKPMEQAQAKSAEQAQAKSAEQAQAKPQEQTQVKPEQQAQTKSGEQAQAKSADQAKSKPAEQAQPKGRQQAWQKAEPKDWQKAQPSKKPPQMGKG